jgi:glycosyltransferase 2 family protein
VFRQRATSEACKFASCHRTVKEYAYWQSHVANNDKGRQNRVRFIAIGLALLALCWAFRDVRLGRVLELCLEIGAPGLVLALFPQAISVALEVQGWARSIRLLGTRVRLASLGAVRVATEALAVCLPAGVMFAESVKVPLLASQVQLPAARAVAAIALRKYLMLLAQAGYLLVAAVLVANALPPEALGLPHGLDPALLIGGVALVLALAALLVRGLLTQAALGTRLEGLMRRLSPRRFAAGAARGLADADRELVAFFRPGAELKVAGWFLLSWLFEAVETFVLLRLLGVTLGFGPTLAMEVTVSLLRSLVFVVPAGLGVQDAGYAVLLRALGVQDSVEVAAAFSLLKRGRELLWVGLGIALFTRFAPGQRPLAPSGALAKP